MDLGADLIEGVFVERVNRFLAMVNVDGQELGSKTIVVPTWRWRSSNFWIVSEVR